MVLNSKAEWIKWKNGFYPNLEQPTEILPEGDLKQKFGDSSSSKASKGKPKEVLVKCFGNGVGWWAFMQTGKQHDGPL